MYRDALITTMMLYKYDNTVFDKLNVPEGMNKETVVNSILLETGELSVIYTSPSSLKDFVGIWSDKYQQTWEELWKTLNYEYEPLWNYDRTENGKDILDGTNKMTRDLQEKAVLDKTDVNDSDFRTDDENQIAAFNNGYADNTKNHSEGDSHSSLKTESENNINQTGNTVDKTDNTNTHFLHAYGNIGVMSTQDLIQQQREVVQFNMIDYIVNSYKTNFCVMVY